MFHQYVPHCCRIILVSSHFLSSTQKKRNKPSPRCMNKHSQFVTFPSRFLSRHSQIVVPKAILLMGVRTSVFRDVPRDHELMLLIPITLARLPLFLECKPILQDLLALRILAVGKSHPELWRLSCATRNIPAGRKSSFTTSPRPFYFWNCFSNSAFLR